MKYRIMTNNYPYSTLIADGFDSYDDAYDYAIKLAPVWCFGTWQWHIEDYKA